MIAAIGLIKFAIDEEHRSWRLILIVLVLGAVALGVLWGPRPERRPAPHQIGATCYAGTSVAGGQGVGESDTPPMSKSMRCRLGGSIVAQWPPNASASPW
jgi:hypothetical protein